ncbi:RNA methyltransferase [Ferrimonas gelatinilytica]|uniref:RNA methyltransferase n=1 Tax=Ferrimonas gelatinilytica TaxID=1255257 RepID=A0ABP9RX84_9GAMM
MTVQIGLTNPKSPSNIGAVMRAAGCYQADAVFYSGERAVRAMKYHTDTQNVAASIPLRHEADLLSAIPADAKLVCVELVEGATPLPHFDHPEHAFYLFGPEDGSLSQAVIDRADAVVYIPTVGCMNLAATVNVLLYDRLAKGHGQVQAGDALIRQSRDTNNRARVPASADPAQIG